MAAIHLKDLINARQELDKKGSNKPVESISVAEFRKMLKEQTESSKEQTATLESIKSIAIKDKDIRLNEVEASTKNDRDEAKNKEVSLQNAKKLLDSNKEILKELKVHSKSLTALSSEKAKKITEKSQGLEQFKTIGERVQGVKQNVKDFFTLKGFLNKTGMVNKDSTGIVATAVNKRAARMQYQDDRMRVDPNLKNLKQFSGDEKKVKQFLGKQFDKQQEVRVKMRSTEKDISNLENRGYTEKQIAKTGLFKDRESNANEMSLVDTRVRESNTGNVKTAEIVKESPSKKTSTAKKEASNAAPILVKTAAKSSTTAKKEASNAAQSNIVPFKKKESIEQANEEIQSPLASLNAVSDASTETQLENAKEVAKQTELLTKIEENTRASSDKQSDKPKKENGKGILDGILDGIMSMLGGGLMNAFKALINPRAILKLLGKVFVPAMIIGSIVNGIVDAFKAFFNGGSFTDVIIAGLGGVLDFLTLGLVDAQTLKSLVDVFSNLIDDYIVNPIKDFFGMLGDAFNEYIASPITKAFEPISNFFKSVSDSIVGFVSNFQIPGISIPIPKMLGGPLQLGPWKPFASTSSNTSKQTESTTEVVNKQIDKSVSNTQTNNSVVSNAKTSVSKTSNSENVVTKTATAKKVVKEGGSSKLESAKKEALDAAEKAYNSGTVTDYNSAVDATNQIMSKYDLEPDTMGKFGLQRQSIDTIRQSVETKLLGKLGGISNGKAVSPAPIPSQAASVSTEAPSPTPTPTSSKASPEKSNVNIANTVYKKSGDNASSVVNNQSNKVAPVVISAPVSNNVQHKQNIVMPTPTRNTDSGFNKYIQQNSVMI